MLVEGFSRSQLQSTPYYVSRICPSIDWSMLLRESIGSAFIVNYADDMRRTVSPVWPISMCVLLVCTTLKTNLPICLSFGVIMSSTHLAIMLNLDGFTSNVIVDFVILIFVNICGLIMQMTTTPLTVECREQADEAIEAQHKLHRQTEIMDTLQSSVVPGGREALVTDNYETVEQLSMVVCRIDGLHDVAADRVLETCHDLQLRVDALAARHSCHRVQGLSSNVLTIVCGLPHARPTHADDAVHFALAFLPLVEHISSVHGAKLSCKIGVHSGRALCGVIGTCRWSYSVIGPDMHLAHVLMLTADTNRVHVSGRAVQLVDDDYEVRASDAKTAKWTKAVERDTYYVASKRPISVATPVKVYSQKSGKLFDDRDSSSPSPSSNSSRFGRSHIRPLTVTCRSTTAERMFTNETDPSTPVALGMTTVAFGGTALVLCAIVDITLTWIIPMSLSVLALLTLLILRSLSTSFRQFTSGSSIGRTVTAVLCTALLINWPLVALVEHCPRHTSALPLLALMVVALHVMLCSHVLLGVNLVVVGVYSAALFYATPFTWIQLVSHLSACTAWCLVMYLIARHRHRTMRVRVLWRAQGERDVEELRGIQTSRRALIGNILPAHFACHYAGSNMITEPRGEHFKQCVIVETCLSAVIQGNAQIEEQRLSRQRATAMNKFICRLDQLIAEHEIIDKLIGDAPNHFRLIVGAAPDARLENDHLSPVLTSLIRLCLTMSTMCENEPLTLSTSMAMGACTTGVIGGATPVYGAWGVPVEQCSRMNNTRETDGVLFSETVVRVLRQTYAQFTFVAVENGVYRLEATEDVPLSAALPMLGDSSTSVSSIDYSTPPFTNSMMHTMKTDVDEEVAYDTVMDTSCITSHVQELMNARHKLEATLARQPSTITVTTTDDDESVQPLLQHHSTLTSECDSETEAILEGRMRTYEQQVKWLRRMLHPSIEKQSIGPPSMHTTSVDDWRMPSTIGKKMVTSDQSTSSGRTRRRRQRQQPTSIMTSESDLESCVMNHRRRAKRSAGEIPQVNLVVSSSDDDVVLPSVLPQQPPINLHTRGQSQTLFSPVDHPIALPPKAPVTRARRFPTEYRPMTAQSRRSCRSMGMLSATDYENNHSTDYWTSAVSVNRDRDRDHSLDYLCLDARQSDYETIDPYDELHRMTATIQNTFGSRLASFDDMIHDI